MSAVLAPDSAFPTHRARPRAVRAPARARDPRLAACVLLVVVLLEVALRFYPDALQLHPFQKTVLFKQISGYSMLALMAFAMTFGWLRRRPALARHHARLNEVHQVSGLLLLALLGFHLGHTPVGFLHYMFQALALSVAAGALRAILGRRIGARGGQALLVVHIAGSCLLAAGALVHLYLVYAYTA